MLPTQMSESINYHKLKDTNRIITKLRHLHFNFASFFNPSSPKGGWLIVLSQACDNLILTLPLRFSDGFSARIKLSHAWDRTIRTLFRKLTSSSTSDDVTSWESPESRSTTSVPSWRVVVSPATSVCSEKHKSGWQDLFLTYVTNPDEWEYKLS